MLHKVTIAIAALLLIISVCGSSIASADTPSNIWIEAEDIQDTNWSPGIAQMILPDGTGTSAGMYLRLYTEKSPDTEKALPFYATYKFNVTTEDTYTFWLGTSPQSVSWCASINYSIDSSPFADPTGIAPSGASYGAPHPENLFCWTNAAKLKLTAGEHTLRIEVRKPRSADNLYACFLDAFLFTTDTRFIPEGNHPKYSPQPDWQEVMKGTNFTQYRASLESDLYYRKIKTTNEEISDASAQEVTRKIMARALPTSSSEKGIHRFGVHGMEAPFVVTGQNDAQAEKAFEMLARTGVDTLRTAESCWHRLGDKYDNFKQMDYQAAQASKYGMNFMLTVGYPSGPAALTGGLTTFKPEYEPQFRNYIQTVLNRYKNVAQYIEYGNEVDAPVPWWINATADMYFRDIKIIKEEMNKLTPKTPLVAFAATYSRNDELGGETGGRRFVDRCFELGINKYADAYSIHYTWGLDQMDFPAFMRREMSAHGKTKPVINSEEAGYAEPYDVIKLFARDLFLYKMESVYYYLARDWFEAGNMIPSGLFDINWKPKLRLLAYAASVDSMKHRRLIGMAKPSDGIEAYVLGYEKGFKGTGPKYSIVMWRTGEAAELGPVSKKDSTVQPIAVTGLTGIKSAINWKLDSIPIDAANPSLLVGDAPIMVGVSKLPKWKLISTSAWLSAVDKQKSGTKALVPQAKSGSHFTLWQLPSQINGIGMSYVIRTDGGKIIVVDGGWAREAAYMRSFLAPLGNKVDAWFISHPHDDHAGVLFDILKNPAGIKIEKLYQSSLPPEWYNKWEVDCIPFSDSYYAAVRDSKVKDIEVQTGMKFIIDGVKFEILGIRNLEITNNPYNNQSIVFKVSDSTKSVLFLGDLGVDGGKKLLAGPYGSQLQADYVQMAHHGQRGVDEAFYKAVSPKYCLWPTPKWLWNNDSGKGPNSGTWDTMQNRDWIEKLGVKENYLSFTGVIKID